MSEAESPTKPTLVNLAFLTVRGGPRDRVTRVVEERGGSLLGEVEGLPTFSFSSPTDAVLTGLKLTETSVAACCAVTAGEIEQGEGAPRGRALEAAGQLAAQGDHGEVLLVEAVYFAMNRNEVSAIALSTSPRNALEQRVFVGVPVNPGTGSTKPTPGTTISANERGSRLPSLETWLLLLGLGSAFLGGMFLAQRPTSETWKKSSLTQQAEELARKQRHQEAAHAFFHAFQENPGVPELESAYTREVLATVQDLLRAGRPDTAYKLLVEAKARTPFREELEGSLVLVGTRYLEELLKRGSSIAFAREKNRFLELLPLREQELRDTVVGLEVRSLLVSWRKAENNRLKVDLEIKTNPFWEESPDNPELSLASAEFNGYHGRLDNMRNSLTRALNRHPEWVRERPEILDMALESFLSMRGAYVRKQQLESHVQFLVQRLGEGLIPRARKSLGSDSVGLRNGALRILQTSRALQPEEALEVFRKNLAGIKDVEERDSPRAEELLLGWIPEFFQTASPERRRLLQESLRQATQTPELPPEELERLQELQEKLP